MKTSEADILFIPGLGGSGPDHWQTRWADRLSTGRVVEQTEWHRPLREDWVSTIRAAVEACARPVILVAHSLGAHAVAHVRVLLEV